ncbi:MAG: hypothetical protein INR71_10255 [Terriglobus roseus]|nr:hypothetical protein [Terriglobus roseus]
MPRFHFNVFDGRLIVDPDGIELSGAEAAREEAVRISGGIIEKDAALISAGNAWAMEVTDQLGQIMFRLKFSVTTA